MAETAPTKMVVSLAPAQQDFRAYNVKMVLCILWSIAISIFDFDAQRLFIVMLVFSQRFKNPYKWPYMLHYIKLFLYLITLMFCFSHFLKYQLHNIVTNII